MWIGGEIGGWSNSCTGSCKSKSGKDVMAWMEEANGKMKEDAIRREREWIGEGECECANGFREMKPITGVNICAEMVKDIVDNALTGGGQGMCDEILNDIV